MTFYPKKSVFVLGAGASCELGLPIGSQLTEKIRKAVDFRIGSFSIVGGDDVLREALSAAAKECPNWYNAGMRISASMPLAPSIDNFVDAHRNDPSIAFVAKAAITRCILEAERASTITVDPSNIYNTIKFEKSINAWHTLFFRSLTINCTIEDLPERLNEIGIVSFNYDRCFEHFLLNAITTYYDVPLDDAAKILSYLEIYHPYGKVGELPGLNPHGAISYGEDVDYRILLSISKQIRTFTESTDENSSGIQRLRTMVFDTKKLIFLGFAFHPLNVSLLFPSASAPGTNYEKKLLATALGSSNSDSELILWDLSNRFGSSRTETELRTDLTCMKLFSEHSRTLAFD